VVDVSFTPNKLTTSTMEILVKVSQFNFEPFACLVTGTGFPSVARDEGVAELAGGDVKGVDVGLLVDGTLGLGQPPGREGFGRHGALGATGGKKSRSATAHSLAATFNRSGGGGGLGTERKQKNVVGGGGAGGGDAYTEYVHRSRKEANAADLRGDLGGGSGGMMRLSFAPGTRGGGGGGGEGGGGSRAPPGAGIGGPRHVKLSESLGGGAHSHSHLTFESTAADFNALPYEAEEEEVDGVYLPPHIGGHANVNYVLMQRRGKLRIKDLKAAIAAKDEENDALRGGALQVESS
jgi:hypothetical protein